MVHLGWRMKLQEEIPGIWRSSGPRGEWEREQELRDCSPPSSPLQGVVRGETEPAHQCLAPGLVTPAALWGFGQGIGSHNTRYMEHTRNVPALTWAPPQPWPRVEKHLAG